MHQEVITQTPVYVGAYEKVIRHKKSLLGVGITQVVIAIFCMGYGAFSIGILASHGYGEQYQRSGWMFISGGAWFVIAGSLAIAASSCPNGCNVTGGIVIAILASLAAFGLMVISGMALPLVINMCSEAYSCNTGSIALLVGLILACVLEFILAIVHASLCCGCCGSTHQAPTMMTVTTSAMPVIHSAPMYGKGYARLAEEGGPATGYYVSSPAPSDAPPMYK